MPARRILGDKFQVNARPDRLDLRDRAYLPPLRPIRPEFPTNKQIRTFLPYYEDLILDQGKEGSCTGYGLAAVINYQYWYRDVVKPILAARKIGRSGKKVSAIILNAAAIGERSVSPTMLYQLAKLYDEWDGEDYHGSSCRGAMRGWHHHGVCLERTWPKGLAGRKVDYKWMTESAERPLGAYFRIETKSISDMQAAILEVYAIYVSARIHSGWDVGSELDELPTIGWPSPKEAWGGHAFAVVGYNQYGFVVQNSWTKKWGYKGFALLAYDDWQANGMDAWAAVRGAPSALAMAPVAKSREALNVNVCAQSTFTPISFQSTGMGHASLREWSEADAYMHSVVIGNEGRALTRLVTAANGREHIRITVRDKVLNWCGQNPENRNLVIYAHGGLNSEEDSLKRIAVLGPYFEANGIYPVFISWKSGLLETLQFLLRDAIELGRLDQFVKKTEGFRDVLDSLGDRIADANDYTWEAVASRLSVRSVWTEMKENAAKAAKEGGGTFLMTEEFVELRKKYPELRIHLVGHSAGAIVFGNMFRQFRRRGLKIDSMGLFAPACTMKFAKKKFGPALDGNILDRSTVHMDLLHERNERDDNVVGVYRKSLLYLISRALEKKHKTPLLGMYSAWDQGEDYSEDTFPDDERHPDIVAWKKVWADGPAPDLLEKREVLTSIESSPSGERFIKSSHGCFDNSTDAISRTLTRILGHAPDVRIEDLTGF